MSRSLRRLTRRLEASHPTHGFQGAIPGNLDKEPRPAFPEGGRGLPAQLNRASPSGREGEEKEGKKRREGEGEGGEGRRGRRRDSGGRGRGRRREGRAEQRRGKGGEKRGEEKEGRGAEGEEGRVGNPQELYPPREAIQS